MSFVTTIAIIVSSSILIYFVGNRFAEASSKIGDYFHIPRSVKGATFDAIASSLPELMIALFALIYFKKFEVGIGTIAGSALFNLLVIPAIAVLVSPVAFKISRSYIVRDGFFYIFSVFALLAALIYDRVWGLMIPIIFLFVYVLYIKNMIKHTQRYKKSDKQKKKSKEINLVNEILIALVGVLVIAVAAFYLTDSAIEFSELIGVPAVIISFTIIAAATSVPDTIVSVVNARKGDIESSISNVFGSNIFDILVGLSIPLIVGFFLIGPTEIIFDNIEVIFGLFGASMIVFYFIIEDDILDKKEAWILLGMYVLFVAYTIYLSII